MTTVAEHAKQIRKTLKAAGISSKQVSVRSESYSMGSSINITIRDLSVPYAVVKAAASEHERIDRDENGEILSGCNRYVSIDLDHDAVKAIAETLGDDGVREFMGWKIYPCYTLDNRRDGESVPGLRGFYGKIYNIAQAVECIYKAGPATLADRICALADG